MSQTAEKIPVSPAPEEETQTPWARFMTDDEYYPFLVKKNPAPVFLALGGSVSPL